LVVLEIWRAVISSDMGLVCGASAIISPYSHLLAIEYPQAP
jgi:hypothetical protein